MQPVTTLELVLSGLAFLAITYLGLAVYLKNPRSWTNRLFLILAIVLNAYVIVNVLSLHPPGATPESQIFWIRVVMFFAALISPSLFLLVHTFPQATIRLKPFYLIGVLVFTAINAVMAMTPLVFKSITYPGGEAVPTIGQGMPIYFVHFVGFVGLSFLVLILRHFRTVGAERIKHFYLLIGVVLTFALMTISTIIFVVILKTSGGVFLGPIFPVILMSAIAYSIVKHHFLDIRPIIARSVSDTILVFITSILYFGFLFAATALITSSLPRRESVIAGIIFAVIVTLTFQPLRVLIRKLTDRLFFKGMYNSERLLSDLTHIMATNLDLDDLINSLLEKLTKEMRVTKAAFLVDGHRFPSAIKGIGYSVSEKASFSGFSLDLSLFDKVESSVHHVFVFEEIKQESLKNIFRQYEIEVFVPVKVSGELVASLVMGSKASGDLYSLQDLKLLDVFAAEAGVAIQNASLYVDLKSASEAKSHFISVVSHQLRTPISGMRWSIETLKQKGLSEKEKESFLDHIYDKTVFLSEQIDNILTALEIYDKKMFLQKNDLRVDDIYKDLINRFMAVIKEKSLTVESEIDKAANFIKCDPEKIKKVIRTLFENAISYSRTGGKIIVRAFQEKISDQLRLVVSIEDDGIGLSKADEQHLFEEFFRSEEGRLLSPNGLGLSLFIARAIIEAHGGTLRLTSSGKNRGTTAYFALPLD